MEGATEFSSALQSIVPGAPSASSLGYLFDESATREFLVWLTKALKPENVLSELEVNEYAQLSQKGRVLHGEALEQAVSSRRKAAVAAAASVSSIEFGGEEGDLEAIREETQQLQARAKVLAAQRDLLTLHLTSKQSQASSTPRVALKVDQEASAVHREVVEATSQKDAALDALASASALLASLHKATSDGRAVYLSGVSLDALMHAEDTTTERLNSYIAKQFALPTESDQVNRYSILHVSQPEFLLFHGESPQVYASYVAQVDRLQEVYGPSVSGLIESKMAAAAASARVSCVQTWMSAGGGLGLEVNAADNAARFAVAFEKSKAVIARDKAALLTPLLNELSSLERISVLSGDYELKLARQRHRLSKQAKVIEHLLSQQARFLVLSIAFEVERELHKNAHDLLSTVKEVLDRAVLDYSLRHSALSQLPHRGRPLLAATLPDSILNTAMRLIVRDSAAGDLASATSLLNVVTEVRERAAAAAAALETVSHSRPTALARLQKAASTFHSLLYEFAVTAQPLLTTADTTRAQKELEKSLTVLATQIEKIISSRKVSLQSLQTESARFERGLFALFLTAPSKLARTVEAAERRLVVHHDDEGAMAS